MIYAMSSESAGLEVLEALSRRYPTKLDETLPEPIVYHDTFDWRLHRAGGFFTSAPGAGGRRLRSRARSGGRLHRLAIDTEPAFARSFPPGALRRELEPILEMRRLLPVVEIERRRRIVHLLDDQGKTVARVELRQGTARRPAGKRKRALPVTLRSVPLRGYEREHEDLVLALETELGLERARSSRELPVSVEVFELELALAAVGRKPREDKSKLRLDLEPSRRSDEAVAEILRTLFETLLANEDGTRRDLDSEFLHDFRVAVRRTRSALTQLKNVFPSPVTDFFRGEFKWLGGATGPTRDLDVYLLKIDGYEALLRESIRSDLEPLRAFLTRRQRIEHERLVAALDSGRYRDLVRSWREFLAAPESSAANAARPIVELASERIWRAYRRVWKKGRAIGPESPADALHGLRIDCKKLRYLLEFFRSLYPASEVDRLIKALKRLQDHLGDFNDLEVQQRKLRDFAAKMEEEGGATAATLLAMGELVAALGRLQEKERLGFAQRFARFSERKNRRAFRRLFGPAS